VKLGRAALLGLLANVVICGAFLFANHGHAEWFVHFGSRSEETPLAKKVLGPDIRVPHKDGHDGQTFWIIARDPLIRHPQAVKQYLSRPAYRYQRIAYPALAAPWRWIGGEKALPWGLLLTNLAAVAVGGWFAAALALRLGAPVRASAAFAISPGVIAAVNLDTADAFALAAVLAALYLLLRKQPLWAVVAAVVAVLAKEASLVAFVGVAVFGGRFVDRRTRLALVLAPAAAAGLWAGYVHLRLDVPRNSEEFSALPFWGYVDAYRRGWREFGNWSDAVVAVLLIPFGAFLLWRWWRRRDLLLAAAVPFVLMIPFFSAQVLDLTDNTIRVMAPALTLLWLDLYLPNAPPPPSRTAV
jgi:hypothetical protein